MSLVANERIKLTAGYAIGVLIVLSASIALHAAARSVPKGLAS